MKQMDCIVLKNLKAWFTLALIIGDVDFELSLVYKMLCQKVIQWTVA